MILTEAYKILEDHLRSETGIPEHPVVLSVAIDTVLAAKVSEIQESEVINKLHLMAIESLSPDMFDKWEDVKDMLCHNRGIEL